ncbi:MAG: Dihydrolipoamide dehydrogenase [uncultured Thermoleophilia bacterium]|uniref:Dihydrolipoyl dehydrogenase n=1 Tax=uncultured Thermoleophilia bacterium TaxID=1497501 RepID=A0A6J4U1Y2_9ACTN|nr:MAG: Dihydrolipoamide dehydrogenase [uncultured Thermoleophilia bacterium]
MDVDVAVLGAGPGGYPAAIRAAQLGLSVAVIEQGPLGGTCLNVGCIPTKAWVQSSHAVKDAHGAFAQLGVQVGEVSVDFGQMQKNKDAIVKKMVTGVGGLLKAAGAQVVQGRGTFTGPNTISVEGGEEVTFRHAVIATGSSPLRPPIEGIDSARCVDSTGLLAVEEIPNRLIVLGGGVIGVEFASIFAHLGTEVTIVEFLDHLIPNEDADAVAALEKAFTSQGITLHLGAKGTKVEESADGVTLHFERGEERSSVTGDLMLVATGRGANVSGFGLDEIGIAYDRKGIKTDGTRRTSLDHIYAVGDVAGYWQLAHTAFREGEVAAENIAGHETTMVGAVPRCIYTDPEIAAVGLTEREAREHYGDERIVTGQFPFAAVARAAMFADQTGFVKTIHETTYGELLGVVVVGINATELINAGVIAIDTESTVETVGDSIAAHPTLAEAFKEAALVALDRPIHMPRKRRRAAAKA